jgi:hypothetical protein
VHTSAGWGGGVKWSGIEWSAGSEIQGGRWTPQHIHLTALSTVLSFLSFSTSTISGFLKMTPRRERVHRATESSSAVDDSVDVGLSSASISPEGNVDGTPGLQHSSSSTFGCNQCSKVFNRRENLSRHLKTRKLSNPKFRRLECMSTSIPFPELLRYFEVQAFES